MNWTKSKFSYVLWMGYTAIVFVCVFNTAMSACTEFNFPLAYGYAAAVGILLAACILVCGIGKLWRLTDLSERIEENTATRVLESLIVVLLFAVGIYLRFQEALSITSISDGMYYYDAAKVTADHNIPQVVHGATYLYLYFLHLVFILLGNKVIVAVGFQVILQLLAGFLVYLGVRRLAGPVSAIFTLAMFMCSPYMIGEALKLSPTYLFLIPYASVLILIGGCLKKNLGNYAWYIIVGALAGVVTYLDVFGITLFVFVSSVFLVEREERKKAVKELVKMFLLSILGGVMGFLLAIGVDALASGKVFTNVLAAWCEIYHPQTLSLITMSEIGGTFTDTALLVILLATGIFSFRYRKIYVRRDVWVVVYVVLTILQGLQMMTHNAHGYAYIYIFLVVIIGISIEEIFTVDRWEEERAEFAEEDEEADVPKKDEKEVPQRKNAMMKKGRSAEVSPMKKQENIEVLPMKKSVNSEAAPVKKTEPAEAASVNRPENVERPQMNSAEFTGVEQTQLVPEKKEEEEAPRQVQFLENPLPLPKKHTPKTMDYSLPEVNKNAYEYDYEVADDDDFDIP